MLGDSNTTLLPSQQITTTTTTIVVAPSPAAPPPSQVAIIAHEGGGPGSDGDRGRDLFDMESGGGGGGGGERSFGGNRWPRQETLALLKIRSDMDAAFKEASVKGPLWDEVSRKLAELGYHRSAKKCREKFENVFKYHKRTKEGRTGKSEGKTYRFFDQLEAFEAAHPQAFALPPTPSPQPRSQTPAMLAAHNPPAAASNIVTVPSSTIAPLPTINFSLPGYLPGNNPTVTAQQPPLTQLQQVQVQQQRPPPQQVTNVMSSATQQANINTTVPTIPAFSPDFMSDSSSSSTSSDMEIQGRHRRKRKWKDFFERLMREVIQKQDDMQRRFLEAIEKREHERMVREESWRMQEMARVNREREILSQERSIAAAKDAAVMAFLQKISEQQNPPGQVRQFVIPQPSQLPPPPQQSPQPTPLPTQQQPQPVPAAAAPPPPLPPPQPTTTITTMAAIAQPVMKQQAVAAKSDNNGDKNFLPASSSRWPKVEVQALINLRTNLDSKYQETGPKGPLWEEISSGMRRLGYNRNSKRCKEKWENINKYFKKVKESNKKRPEDSKTCPYFHQLDALYKEKTTRAFDGSASASSHLQFRPENSVPLLVQPEQQWPPLPPPQQDANMEDLESEQDDDDDKDNDDEDDEEGAAGYEIVANSGSKPATMSTGE